MKIIDSPEAMARALSSPLDPLLDRLLRLRVEQLTGYEGYALDDLAVFIIVEPGDTLAAVEAELRISLTVNLVDGACWPDPDFCPNWEWCEDHGALFELTFILDDSGYGHVLFVPKSEGIDTVMLSICAAFTDIRSCD